MHSTRIAITRGLAAFTAVVFVFTLHPAYSSPGDIFSIPAPAIGSDPPKAADLKSGDATVSTQTGAMQYSYPITVPPGRNGMAPSLALSYSSQAPTYGGIAAGWSLPIPMISEDKSRGRLESRSPEVEQAQIVASIDPRNDDRFVSSLAGGRELVAITEPIAVADDVFKTYRAQSDSSWARYERMNTSAPYRWRVRTTDGVVMTFGQQSRAAGCPVSDQFAPLTGTVDAFGNEVSYHYKWSANECMLQQIFYGQNVVSGLPSFARIDIESDTQPIESDTQPICNGVFPNSQVDHRIGATTTGGTRIVTGANRISAIKAFALTPGTNTVEHTRQISLGYDATSEACSTTAPHAPVRLLTSIQESAWGATSNVPQVVLPAVLFTYNDRTITRTSPTAVAGPPWGTGNEAFPTANLGWGYRRADDRWPSVEMMFQDIDGDGRQDLVMNASVDAQGNISACKAKWRRNISSNGVISFEGTERMLDLPRLKWKGAGTASAGSPTAQRPFPELEGCSLNGQATAFSNSQQSSAICHDNSACAASADPQNQQRPYCYPGGTECPPGEGGNALGGIYRTYLAYRWLDVDSDGLVDLVAAVHGDIDTYDIELGNMLDNGQVRAPEPSISGLPGTGNPNVPWPACPGTEVERCHDFGNCLTERGATNCTNGLCTINWSVFNTCVQLPETSTTGCQGVMAKGVAPPANSPTPSNLSTRGAYMRCEGLYPWFIYKNTGGAFATTPIIKYQPVPLESASGDSNFSGPSIAGQDHAVMDFDGDGFLDAIARDVNGGNEWQVWLGDGTGGFRPRAFRFPTRPINCTGPSGCIDKPGDNAISGTGGLWGGHIGATRGTIDLDGDGLPDHWKLEQPQGVTSVDIAANDGARFRLAGPQFPPTGEQSLPSNVRFGDNQLVYVASPPQPIGSQQILSGDSRSGSRVTDVDNDGRPDLVVWNGLNDGATPPGAPATAKVHYNVGGNFLADGPAYPGNAQGGIRRRATAGTTGNTASTGESLTWKLDADMIDLDGDGIEEALWFTPSGFYLAVPTSTQPQRLLKTISNQRGATTEITYADMHDSSVVEQSELVSWWDGRKKMSPRTQWVVSQMKRTEQFSSAPPAYTAYKYRHPRFSRGDHSWGFRGFEEVITTNPGPAGLADGSGSKTVQRYDYVVDWSGRLVETLVQPGSADGTLVAGETRSIERTTWKERTLFGGALTTFHVVSTEKLVCANGQTDPSLGLANPCLPTVAPGYVLTGTDQTPLPESSSSNDHMMWVDTKTYVQSGPDLGNGDRETLTTYMLSVSDTRYFLKPEVTTRNHRVAGAMVLYGKSESTWNPDYGTHLAEATWVSADPTPSSHLIERWVYDDTTGNVLERWKPKQNAAGTTKTTFDYDARELFVATEINELGHKTKFVYEYGTGAKLVTSGPNKRTCQVGTISCPAIDATHPEFEEHRVRVDGLGRMIERWETVSPDGYAFTLYQAETNSYDDTATSTEPTSTTNRVVVDESETPIKWREERTELDGRGRPIRKIVAAQGSATADHITVFSYRADGTLQSVAVPNPKVDDTSLVTYTYTFDSLGRPKSIRRPDSTTSQSGIDITYNGATQTTTEVVGAAGGQIGETQTINDRFGRLWQVREKTAASTYATTTYQYDPDDNVASITDPANVVTTLVHDFAGRRTQITRGTRTWTYGYDKNGNMVFEQVPGSTGSLTDLNFQNTTVYDDLDRPLSKTIGRRSLSDPDLSLFMAATETFQYDVGYIGRLRYWRAFGLKPGAEWGTDTYYDGQGRETLVAHHQGMAGYPAQTRNFQRGYNINGTVRYVRPFDQMGGSNETVWVNRYDARNFPSKIELQSPQAIDIAVQTRNVAGLVKNRRTNLTGAMTHIESNWSYDELGRVTDQQVLRKLAVDPTTSQVARQRLTYFGNDDVKTLEHQLFGLTSRMFTYGYDLRHQITNTQTDTASYFRATYGYNLAGRLTSARHARSISPTPANAEPRLVRNVNYVYGGADPEQVTSLTNVSGGGTFASYTYDDAGNQLTRSYPATNELFEYTYDGQDQLRRVVRKLSGTVTGSEEYWYDGSGQRAVIVKRNASGTKTGMVWFIGDVEAHYNGAGAATKTYSHLSMGTPVARVERTSTTTSLEFQFHGLANNTLAAVAQNGTINASFVYAPFGERLESTDGGAGQGAGLAAHKRRFNDKYEDDLSSLAYYGARYYDRTQIAWTQGDPLFRFAPDAAWVSPRRGNLYVFTLQNTLRYEDPDGRNPFKLRGAGAALSKKMENAAGRAQQIVNTAVDVAQVASNLIPGGFAVQLAKLAINTAIDQAQGQNEEFDPESELSPLGMANMSTGGGPNPGKGNAGPTAKPANHGSDSLDPPDHYVVVRGGEKPMPPPGETFSGATGADLSDAAQGVPHGQVRETTAGKIRKEGGRVVRKPEPTRSGKMNQKHVEICLGGGPCPFGPLQTNPVPKKDRVD